MNRLLKAKRDEIERIAKKYGAKDIKIFGSYARGTEDKASDIDFLVNLEEGRSLFDLGGMQMDLEELLGCTVVGAKASLWLYLL